MQKSQDFKKGDLLLTLLRNIDLEMLPHLKKIFSINLDYGDLEKN